MRDSVATFQTLVDKLALPDNQPVEFVVKERDVATAEPENGRNIHVGSTLTFENARPDQIENPGQFPVFCNQVFRMQFLNRYQVIRVIV